MSDWEGGRRQGIRWRPAVVVVVVVALGGAAAYSLRTRDQLPVDNDNTPIVGESEMVEVVITAPLQAGDRWYCPSTHPVRAYAEGAYYPVGYPRGNGQVARPDECYETDGRAEAAGYRRAAPPAGTVEAAGIYVEPTRVPSRDDCRAMAADAGFTVPCPTRLPAPAEGPACGRGVCVYGGGVVIQHNNFVVPGAPPWSGTPRDVVVTAVQVAKTLPNGAVRLAGHPELVSCFPEGDIIPRGPREFRTCVDARPWVPGFGGYPLERHTAAVWRRGDVVYAAGVMGAGNHVDALLAAVIDGIDYVAPPT